MDTNDPGVARANAVRTAVWERLLPVARPDSRRHFDFTNMIPDFEGSDEATRRLLEQPFYRTGTYGFVTPDNGLVDVRRDMIETGRTLVVSTCGIYRGFVLIEPGMVPAGLELYAAWLDGLEHFGRPITLAELRERGRFDFMVTGASAVSPNGVRFGKGHGFFDLEWGMFTDLGLADERTPVAAVVHDVQVVEESLEPGPTDILVDSIVTPTRVMSVQRGVRPHGIHWDRLEPHQLAETPPLQELQRLQAGPART